MSNNTNQLNNMNREIKFRVWIHRYKEFKYWGFIDGFFIGCPTGSGLSIEKCKELSQQYTGLKDKNGKEAYEGDVCMSKEIEGGAYYYQIFRVAGGFAVNTHEDDFSKSADGIIFYEGLSDMQTMSWFRDCVEIIGNIYENPELLTTHE